MGDPTDDFLAHYGVKGMRWGKRKAGTDVEVSSKSKKAPIDSDKLSAARNELYKGTRDRLKTKGGKAVMGAAVVTTLLGGPIGSQIVGAQMMRDAGYSKGKSLTMGIVGGAPGAMLAIELKARKMARE
ncbi:hypothetical protein PBI_SPORTO_10 [Arthrobacter phage Sporto]|nr:hypothetical protein PBI_SPORTO_10 [Arthrobacter phage Sporto]